MTPVRSGACPDDVRLERLAVQDRAATGSSADDLELWSHVDSCAGCRSRMERVRSNNALLRDFLPADPSSLGGVLPIAGGAGNQPADDLDTPSLPADSFAGYQLLREIHRGGQGVVFQAIQKSTRRKVAVKVMRDGALAGGPERARFEREIQVLGQLNHPNIVGIHDSGSAAGHDFFVMDYIAGEPLDVYAAQSRLTIPDTLHLFAKICDAVNAAHLRGIIHRDLKPGNIRVDSAGEPHVLDFGLAKTGMDFTAEGGAPMTRSGQFVGSLPWASPEQAEARSELIDVRTDVYSLGVTLYQLLTGQFPYEVVGGVRDVLDRIIRAQPVRPRIIRKLIDDETETIVLKCLAKPRDARYQSAGELARDLRHYLADEPLEAKRESTFYVIRKQLRRKKGAVAAAALVLVLLLGFTVAMSIEAQRNRRLAERKALAEEEAVEARSEAETQRGAAVVSRNQAEREAYLANIAAASAALMAHDSRTAQQRLERAPQSLRNWEWYFLNGQTDQSIAAVRGAKSAVSCGALSPDGRWLATGSGEKTIRIWDASDLHAVRTLRGHRGAIQWLAFSPDGTRLASASWDKTARIWDPLSGQTLVTLRGGHSNYVNSVEFSPDGRRVATGGRDGKIHIWDAASGQPIVDMPDMGKEVHSVAFAPDGALLAAGVRDNSIRLFDAATGSEIRTLNGHQRLVRWVVFNRDGSRLASASADGTAKLWDPRDGRELLTLRHPVGVTPVNFSHDGRLLATGAADNVVRTWDARSGQQLGAFIGHMQRVFWVVFSPDDSRLISGASDCTVRVWDLATNRNGIAVAGPMTKVGSMAFGPDSSLLVLGTDTGEAMLWDLGQNARRAVLGVGNSNRRRVAFSRDGARVATTDGDDHEVVLWSVGSGTVERRLIGHQRTVTSVDFDPDGIHLASASADRTVIIWDTRDGSPQQTLRGHTSTVWSVSYSHDGARLATGSDDTTIRLWDAITGAPLGTLSGHTKPVLCVAFSPDGARVAAASADRTASIWETATGRRTAVLTGHGREVQGVAFSPDGTRLASASWDNTVKLWDVARGDEVLTLSGALGPLYAVAFSPNGEILAAGGHDGTVHLWRTSTRSLDAIVSHETAGQPDSSSQPNEPSDFESDELPTSQPP